MTINGTRHSTTQRCIHTSNLGFLSQTCKRYAPDTTILNTRSEVKAKVTVTREWYVTLHHLKMHWNSYLKEYKRYAPDTTILKTRSEVKIKGTVTQGWYATLCHLKINPHTKFGVPTSNNVRDMLRTRLLKKTSL